MKKQKENNLKRFIPSSWLSVLRKFVNVSFISNLPLVHRLRLQLYSRQEIFSKAYLGPVWGSEESFSGTGSTLEASENVRRELPNLIKLHDIKTMLDAPCGDWNWMSQIETSLEHYIGVDIVPGVIENNTKKYGKPNVEFLCRNIVADDLPSVDLIICRDCLVHLSFQDIKSVIENFKLTDSTFLLTNTYPKIENNDNLFTGLRWRPLNMKLRPFRFPEPLLIFPDTVSLNDGSYMALWRIKDIPMINL